MVTFSRTRQRHSGGAIRAVGLALALLALALQGLVPLADARWHASLAGAAGDGARVALGAERPLKPTPQPASADHACQFCIALQTASAGAPPDDAVPAAPVAYTIVATPRIAAAAPSAPPTERPQPRAPPVRV